VVAATADEEDRAAVAGNESARLGLWSCGP
jgi:hypothetical protein